MLCKFWRCRNCGNDCQRRSWGTLLLTRSCNCMWNYPGPVTPVWDVNKGCVRSASPVWLLGLLWVLWGGSQPTGVLSGGEPLLFSLQFSLGNLKLFFSVTPRTFVPSSVNSSGGNVSVMEETSGLWQDGMDGERQRDPEAREPDAVDGTSTAAEINSHRRGSGDKYKASTYAYQVRGRGH